MIHSNIIHWLLALSCHPHVDQLNRERVHNKRIDGWASSLDGQKQWTLIAAPKRNTIRRVQIYPKKQCEQWDYTIKLILIPFGVRIPQKRLCVSVQSPDRGEYTVNLVVLSRGTGTWFILSNPKDSVDVRSLTSWKYVQLLFCKNWIIECLLSNIHYSWWRLTVLCGQDRSENMDTKEPNSGENLRKLTLAVRLHSFVENVGCQGVRYVFMKNAFWLRR